jgi:hypothetical protein
MARFEALLDNVVSGLDEELEHESTPLAPVQSVRTVVVHQCHLLCTLEQAIEVVGIYRYLVFDGGHAECLAQVVGDERRVASGFGELAFVHR